MRGTKGLMVVAAAGLAAGGVAACGRSPSQEVAPAPAVAAPAVAAPATASSDTSGKGSGALPATPSGLEQFVAAVPAPPDTVGTCGTIAGAAFGEPALRGITWTVSPVAGGPQRRVLLLVDSAGAPQHFSDLRGADPRTEIAVNLQQGIGTATNFSNGKTTARVIAPAAAVLAATSLGNGTRVARLVLAQCKPAGSP